MWIARNYDIAETTSTDTGRTQPFRRHLIARDSRGDVTRVASAGLGAGWEEPHLGRRWFKASTDVVLSAPLHGVPHARHRPGAQPSSTRRCRVGVRRISGSPTRTGAPSGSGCGSSAVGRLCSNSGSRGARVDVADAPPLARSRNFYRSVVVWRPQMPSGLVPTSDCSLTVVCRSRTRSPWRRLSPGATSRVALAPDAVGLGAGPALHFGDRPADPSPLTLTSCL